MLMKSNHIKRLPNRTVLVRYVCNYSILFHLVVLRSGCQKLSFCSTPRYFRRNFAKLAMCSYVTFDRPDKGCYFLFQIEYRTSGSICVNQRRIAYILYPVVIKVCLYQRVWIKRGDVSYVFMLCVAHIYMFHFPSVTLCKGEAVHENVLLFSSILHELFWSEQFLLGRDRKVIYIAYMIVLLGAFAEF